MATDGYDVEPFTADSFILFGGERFDVIIKADRPVGNYWIRVENTATKTKDEVSQIDLSMFVHILHLQELVSFEK